MTAIEALKARAAWLDREAMIRKPVESLAKGVRAMWLAQEKAFWREWEELQKRKPALEAAGPTPSDLAIALDIAIEETEDQIVEPFAASAAKAVSRGATSTIEQLELAVTFSFAVDDARTLEYIAAQGAKLVSNVSATTRRRMRLAIDARLRERKGIGAIARYLRDHFRNMRTRKPQEHIRDRAELIAVTELGEAFETGGALAAADLKAGGIAIEKQWITTGDDRVSDGCLANEAAGWIADDATFPSGHQHPLRFPGCRCATGRRLKPDRE